MAETAGIERVIRLISTKMAEYRAESADLAHELEPVETIAEMYRDLETLDSDNLLLM